MIGFLAWTLGLSLPFAQSAEPMVRSAKDVVSSLAQHMGRKVEIEKALGGLPVFVDPGKLSDRQMLEGLAGVLHATLAATPEGFAISRSAKDKAALREAHRVAMAAQIQPCLDRWAIDLKKGEALGSVAKQVRTFRDHLQDAIKDSMEAQANGRPFVPPGLVNPEAATPAGRLMLGLALRCGVPKLSDSEPDEVRTLSDRPLPSEEPLPECRDLLRTYAAERSRYLAEEPDAGSAGPAGKTLFVVRPEGFSLKIFDPQGRLIDSSWIGLSMEMISRPESVQDAGLTSKWVTLRESSRQMLSFVSAPYNGRSKDWKGEPPAAFLSPEKSDPLDFAVREGVRAIRPLSSTGGFVAVLSDGLLPLAERCVTGEKLDVARFERLVVQSGRFEKRAQDGATILRPTDPLLEEADRSDRAMLGASIRRMVKEGKITIATWCSSRLAQYKRGPSTVADAYFGGLRRLNLARFRQIDSLSSHQSALLGGVLAALPAGSRQVVPDSRLKAMIADGLRQEWIVPESREKVVDIAKEPTTLLAAMTSQGTAVEREFLRIPVASRTRGTPMPQAEQTSFVGAPANALGSDTLFAPGVSKSPDKIRERIETVYGSSLYQYGRLERVAVTLGFNQNVFANLSAEDQILEMNGVTFDALPKAFREELLASAFKAANEIPRTGGAYPSPTPMKRQIP